MVEKKLALVWVSELQWCISDYNMQINELNKWPDTPSVPITAYCKYQMSVVWRKQLIVRQDVIIHLTDFIVT